MGALVSYPIITALATPTTIGATVGVIFELLSKEHTPGVYLLESTVTGVAFGVLKYYFGLAIAGSVLVFSLIGRASAANSEIQDIQDKIKRYVGITLIGALVGYGLSSIPTEFWNLPEGTRFHVHLNR